MLLSPLKIIHLEDNLSDAAILKRELNRSGDDVILLQTKNKEEFVKLLTENECQLVLSEYSIPGLNHLEAFELARQIDPTIPFIIVSESISGEKAVELLKLGVTDYVGKNNLVRLSFSIKRALNEIREQRQKANVEIRIKESEAQYRGLFEKMNEGLLFSTPKGVIKIVNPGFCRMVGYTEEELVGMNGHDLLLEDEEKDRVKEKIKVRQEEVSEQYEATFITKSGAKVQVQISVSPHYNNAGIFQGVMSIISNITDRKKAEQEAIELKAAFMRKLEIEVSDRTMELGKAKMELAMSLKKEQELGELKSRFVTTASHQFRTPLTVILSSMGILSMQMDSMNDGFKPIFEKAYRRIREQIDRMTSVMNDVLILGKINAGNIKPVFKLIDVVELCEKVATSYNQIQHDKRSVEIKVLGTPVDLNLDASLIEHSISNFISNAFKYSSCRPSPLLTLNFEPKSVRISIKDHGIGIPSEAIEHLFEPFYRASNVDEVSGTGLGTAIAKEYVELNNGKIEVKSKLDEGSEFILIFPYMPEKDLVPS